MTPSENNPYAPPLSEAAPAPAATTRSGNLFLRSAGDATGFVLRHPAVFLLLSLGVAVPIDVVDTYLELHADELGLGPRFVATMFVVANLVALISWAALIDLAQQDETGELGGIGPALVVAGATFLTLLACEVVTGLLIVMGLLLVLIPGLYLGMRFFFLVPIVVVERQSVWRSLAASWQFTESRHLISFLFGALFTVVIALILGWELLLIGIWEVAPWEEAPELAEMSWLIQPVWRIPTTLLADWFTVMTFYGYWRLRSEAAESAAAAVPGASRPLSPLAGF